MQVIYIDFAKVFDTVYQNILLSKLSTFSTQLPRSVISWLLSYLSYGSCRLSFHGYFPFVFSFLVLYKTGLCSTARSTLDILVRWHSVNMLANATFCAIHRTPFSYSFGGQPLHYSDFISIQPFLTLLNSLVRNILEYWCRVWSPFRNRDCHSDPLFQKEPPQYGLPATNPHPQSFFPAATPHLPCYVYPFKTLDLPVRLPCQL